MSITSYNDTVIVLYLTYNFVIQQYDFCSISSTDGGVNWSVPAILETMFLDNLESTYLVRAGNTLVTKGMWDYYYSNDWGLTWTIMLTPSGGSLNIWQSENNSLLLLLPVGGSMDAGLYYSNNGVQNWTIIDTVHDHLQNALLKDSIFYIIVNNYDSIFQTNILRSSDFGATWDTTYTVPSNDYFNGLYCFEGNIYSVTSIGYQVSYDNGYTWAPSIYPIEFGLTGTIPLSNGDYLNNRFSHIDRYVTSQNIFYPTQTGIGAEYSSCLESHNGVLYTSTRKKGFRSTDAGMTWSPLFNSLGQVSDFLFRGDTILCLYYYNQYFIGRSFDNGLTWDSIPTVFANSTSIEEINGRLFIGGGASTRFSDDWGLTWNSLTINVANLPGNCVTTGPNMTQVFFLNVDTLLFGVSNDGLIAKYNNQNQTWDFVYCFWSTGANNRNKLYKLDNYIVMAGSPGIYYSNNQTTWTSAALNGLPNSGQPNVYIPLDIVSINGTWFGTCDKYGVYYSNDQGNNWQPIQGGSTPFYARGGLTVLNNILFSGSYYSSIWRRSGAMEYITGNVYHDINYNGIKDNGETNLNQIIVKTSSAPFKATTNISGDYSLLTDAIGDTLSVVLPSNFCSSNPSYYITNGAAISQDFGIQIEPNIYDLSVDITNVNVFRPGFDTEIILTAKNNGSVAQAPQVKLVLDSIVQFISSIPPPSFQAGDSLIWLMPTLGFLESQSISVVTKTPTTAGLSDTVHCFASVTPVLVDTIPEDNYAELLAPIVGSYDPNDKTCSFGNYFTPDQLANNEELNYVIRFQNTGNYLADFVHIKDTLSNYFDLSTFRVISSSHLMHWTISNAGIVDFYFDNIFLPPSSTDELNSHGYVKYGLKCKESVELGNAMVNTAYIYFDFNTAIITNTTTTLVAYPVVILTQVPVNVVQNNTILVFPNPATEELYIDLRGINDDNLRLQVFDMTGNAIKNEVLQKTAVSKIEINNLPAGIYLGTVLSHDQKIGNLNLL